MLVIKRPSIGKFFAVAIAASFATTAVLPVTQASAGHRHKIHKKIHKNYGHKRRNNNGDLFAAGIIGLAIGAIIAGSNNNRSHRVNTYHRYPAPVPPRPTTHNYNDPYYDGYGNDNYIERQPLSDYSGQSGGYNGGYPDQSPQVITYEDTVSYEPWSQGWYNYCETKYRSFNPQKGTFRGYDGLDHFCVIK